MTKIKSNKRKAQQDYGVWRASFHFQPPTLNLIWSQHYYFFHLSLCNFEPSSILQLCPPSYYLMTPTQVPSDLSESFYLLHTTPHVHIHIIPHSLFTFLNFHPPLPLIFLTKYIQHLTIPIPHSPPQDLFLSPFHDSPHDK